MTKEQSEKFRQQNRKHLIFLTIIIILALNIDQIEGYFFGISDEEVERIMEEFDEQNQFPELVK